MPPPSTTSSGADVKRIAMWSGPRNLSTALMRSFGSRPDTFVTDEPLYAHYLKVTHLPHPGADEVIAHHDADWRSVVRHLTLDPIPTPGGAGKTIWYQKHMAHHLIPEITGRAWIERYWAHGFLIRDPTAMLLSLSKVTPEIALADTGLPQQLELYHSLAADKGLAPVIDSSDILRQPRLALTALCDAMQIPFDEHMLSWTPGPRPETDGVWAKYWYASVYQSTCFEARGANEDGGGETPPLPSELRDLHAQCREYYDELYRHRIRV